MEPLSISYALDTVSCYEDIKDKIEIPSIQRDLNIDRVEDIRNYLRECRRKKQAPLMGTVDICLYGGKFFVIDGQHRLKALEFDYKESKVPIPFPIIIYDVRTSEEMGDIFRLRNKSVKVPDFILEAEDGQISLLKECRQYLLSLPLFVDKSRCNRPSIPVDRFMDAFVESSQWDTVSCIEDFRAAITRVNNRLYRLYEKSSEERKMEKISDTMWETVNSKKGGKICLGLPRDFDYLNKKK